MNISVRFCAVDCIGFWPLNDKYQGSDISVNHNNAILSNTNYTEGPFLAGRSAYRFGQTGTRTFAYHRALPSY